MTEEEVAKLAYLAGIIDGEGSIGIERSRKKYQLRLRVGNTDTKLTNWLKENFGGTIDPIKAYSPNQKQAYEWRLSGHETYKLLKKMDDFLMLKREQADIAERFWYETQRHNYRGGMRRPGWVIERQEQYYQRMKELNKKGK